MIDKIIVYLTQLTTQKVGTLAQKNRKIYFEYDKEFLKSNLQISPYKLPLKPGVQLCRDDVFDGLWGVFADSMSDGWGKLLLDRHLVRLGVNPNSITPLDRLLYVGKFGMGALSYEPCYEMKKSFIEEIILDDLAKSSANILQGDSYLVDELLALSGSSAGARPKVMVQLSSDKKEIVYANQPLKSGYSHYLVKFASSSDTKDIGAVEYAYSLMAKEAGLDVPESVILEGKRGRYFATKRFDREQDKRVHMHSVAGLIHSDFRFPALDYDDLLHLSFDLTKDIREVEKVFRLAVFNLLAHNRDDHAKNFSFLMDESGRWRFSPVYDLTFSYGPGGEHSTMYLGEGKAPTKEHLTKLAKIHSLKNAKVIIDEVESAVSRWKEFAKEVNIPSNIIKF